MARQHTMAAQITAADALLERLADEGRRVLSPWRAVILLRRATRIIPPEARRWHRLPSGADGISSLLRQMRARGEIKPIPQHTSLFEVVVPYARQGFLDEREILFELDPFCAISHLSAMEFHGLTYQQPKRLFITAPTDGNAGLIPTGTRLDDWEDISLPSAFVPRSVLGQPVDARRVQPARFLGIGEYGANGFPMRYTTLERTLIDGLMVPDSCGGIDNVLEGWVVARDRIMLDRLIDLVDQLDIGILRQRVGFVLESLGVHHARLDAWQVSASRGGSRRLVASLPDAATYDERWGLSINVPVDILRDTAA